VQIDARKGQVPESYVDQLSLTRADFVDQDSALAREWLVTNGLGGFACGTVAQANTRRYHALLVAALAPPGARTVMVAKLDATVSYQGSQFELACNEYVDGTIAPRGFAHLCAFHLEDGIPVWTYALADARLEERIWMAHGRNTTYVSFTLRHASRALELSLLPLCTYRDYHAHTHGGSPFDVTGEARGCRINAFTGARPYRLLIDRGKFLADANWYWHFHHRIEAERGLDASEDLFRPGTFHARLAPNETVTWIATAESEAPMPAPAALDGEVRRRQSLVAHVTATVPGWIRKLTFAADQFVVARAAADGKPPGTSVIAGYPWFGDWGRDTMIALPGLVLATQRSAEAASILRTFAGYASEGMLPNRFPEQGEAPEYNTVDATLWFFHAVSVYVEASGDQDLLRDLFPVMVDIFEWHRRGTRFGIKVDAEDGLLRAGEPGVQLTWMDAKVGDRVITARIGKPVEINALWHFALASMARWAQMRSEQRLAREFERNATQVARNFARAFWCEARGYLYDVVDAADGAPDARGRRVDASLRPNQIFAVSLGTKLLDARRARAVVDVCGRELLTPVGLRTLAAGDPHYAGVYQGSPAERDAAYHQGTVWAWLLGPFALAHHRVYQDANYAMSLLAGLAPHLGEGCLGSISEIFDGDAPHAPRGCFAHAWSVAQTLYAWHALTRRAAAPVVD
jgi:predicted glycogen debranching enzyme